MRSPGRCFGSHDMIRTDDTDSTAPIPRPQAPAAEGTEHSAHEARRRCHRCAPSLRRVASACGGMRARPGHSSDSVDAAQPHHRQMFRTGKLSSQRHSLFTGHTFSPNLRMQRMGAWRGAAAAPLEGAHASQPVQVVQIDRARRW